jgi:hypothetical protein
VKRTGNRERPGEQCSEGRFRYEDRDLRRFDSGCGGSVSAGITGHVSPGLIKHIAVGPLNGVRGEATWPRSVLSATCRIRRWFI